MNKKRRERERKKMFNLFFLDHLLYKTLVIFVYLFLKFLNVKNYTNTHPIENVTNIIEKPICNQNPSPKSQKQITTQLICKEKRGRGGGGETNVNPNYFES
jgi:hypothetical protein